MSARTAAGSPLNIAITGARSYSGKYITRRLLSLGASVRTLTTHPNRPDPFGGRVPSHPLDFDHPQDLQASLYGCDTLINTYWIRFDRASNTQARAVQNTRTLIAAAQRAGVRRVVHISITNPSIQSDLPYFRGKAENEQTVMDSKMSYAIVRPTVLFGTEDILINNIAFLLRRFPVFLVAGDGRYSLQPIFVDDLAEVVVGSTLHSENYVWDAVGPETFLFRDMVSLIGRAIGHGRPLLNVSPRLLFHAARFLGVVLGDVLLTELEIKGLMRGLLTSSEPPRGKTRFSEWLVANRGTLGRSYASELDRHYLQAG